MGANSAEWNNPLDRISNFCPSPLALPPANTVPKDAARARNRIVVVRVRVLGPNRGRQNLLAVPPVTYAHRPQCERRNVGNEC